MAIAVLVGKKDKHLEFQVVWKMDHHHSCKDTGSTNGLIGGLGPGGLHS